MRDCIPEDKIKESVADVDAYIESLKGPIITKTGQLWTDAELATERSERFGEELSKSQLVLSVQDEIDIARFLSSDEI